MFSKGLEVLKEAQKSRRLQEARGLKHAKHAVRVRRQRAFADGMQNNDEEQQPVFVLTPAGSETCQMWRKASCRQASGLAPTQAGWVGLLKSSSLDGSWGAVLGAQVAAVGASRFNNRPLKHT